MVQPGGVGEKVNPPDVPAGNHKIWRNTHIMLYMILNDRVKMESLVILDLLVVSGSAVSPSLLL